MSGSFPSQLNSSHSAQDEEANLLESMGGSVALMSSYEEGVLRQATLDAAPQLIGMSFPTNALESMLPSYNARTNKATDSKSDILHVRTLLTRTRSILATKAQSNANNAKSSKRQRLDTDNEKETNILRLKEQMLLSCLMTKVSPEDWPIQQAREIMSEHKLSVQLKKRNDTATSYKTKSVAKPPRKNRKNIGTASQKSILKNVPSSAEIIDVDEHEESEGDRLERIKSVSFSSTLEQHRLHPKSYKRSSSPLRKRQSLMERKAKDRACFVYEKDEDIEKLKETIRQRRKERHERKRQRRQRWAATSTSNNDDDEEEEEAELELDDGTSSSKQDNAELGNETNEDENGIKKEEKELKLPCSVQPDSVASAPDVIHTSGTDFSIDDDPKPDSVVSGSEIDNIKSETVTCPLCQQSIDVIGSVSADAALSAHIDQCQQRPIRRSTRRRTSPADAFKQEVAIPEEKASDQATKRITRQASAKKSKKRSSPAVVRAVPVETKPSIDDLDEWAYEDRVDEWIESGISRMREMKERNVSESPPGAEEYPGGLGIPAWINDRLFGYQRTGLRWMWELHMQEAGGIVGDEMGLGKTVQVCSYLGAMAASRKLDSVLIISPATMLQHWLNELKTWAPGLRRILVHASGETDGASRSLTPGMLRKLEKWLRKARRDRVNEAIDEQDYVNLDEDTFCGTGYVIVTTYENVRRMPDVISAHNFSYAVLDEGQKIRNPDADVTLACKRLRTPHRLLLSGTPIQNDLRELWSLFDFVFPGRLGTLPTFEAEFSDPIKRGGYSNASPMQVQLAYRCALVLRDLINPYLLRRQKKDVEEVSRMPGKTEQVLFCRLSERQRSLYQSYLNSDEVRQILRGSTQLLKSVTVLRKICNHPDLVCDSDQASFESFCRNGYVNNADIVSSDDEDSDDECTDGEESIIERAGKLEILAKILPLWRKQGHRVLIFCQWKKMLNIIQRFTQVQGWKFARMDGNTNVAARQQLVDTFNEDDSYFGMLMTTRTGGVGLNLTGADRIILYDPDWNPQTDAQARERAWRFGQKKAVTVYRLITAGTIEEKIYQRQIFKTALSNKVLQDPRQRRLFSQRDLKDLFTLKADVGSLAKGGQGLTETGQLSRGGGVVDPDEKISSATDDKDALESVMKSKGLAGVFDHDFVDDPSSKKSASALEMEQQAKRVASEAARALRESIDSSQTNQPTWTGSSETEPRRFGGGNKARFSTGGSFAGQSSFGRVSVGAGVVSSENSSQVASGDLLAHLRHRNNQVSASSSLGASSQISASGDTSKYQELLKKLQAFVRQGPTTDQILKEFDCVPNSDAAVFRRLLNSVAKIEKGRWRLKATGAIF